MSGRRNAPQGAGRELVEALARLHEEAVEEQHELEADLRVLLDRALYPAQSSQRWPVKS